MTKGENTIQEKLNAMGNMIRSDDLDDLTPKTTREFLMIMWPTQKSILKHLERLNDFKMNVSGRVRFLEAAWKVGGAIILVSLFGLALSRILGW